MSFNLQSKLEKIGKIITRQYGVNIVFQGDQAYTDGKTIVLPSVPPGGFEASFETDLEGYLDHESAHCLFTDFSIEQQQSNNFFKMLFNHAEDSRIEREMINKYPGCVNHLAPLNTKWLSFTLQNWKKQSIQNKLLQNLRAIFDGREIINEEDTSMYITKDISDLAKKICDTKSTKEVYQVCEEIFKLLDDEAKKQEKEQQDKKDQKEKTKNKKETKKSDNENKDQREENSDDNNSASENQSSEIEDEDSQADISTLLSSEINDSVTDIHSFMEKEIKKEIKKEKALSQNPIEEERNFANGKHLPLTTKHDTLEIIKNVDNDYLSDLKTPLVSKLAAELERLLKTKENEHWSLERERGRLSNSRLNQLISDPNYRTPFKEKISTETKNVAVQIVVDCSGSMSSEYKINVARQCAYTIAEALKRIDIVSEVVGFSTGEIEEDIDLLVENKIRKFNRIRTNLRHFIFKPFDSADLKPISAMYTYEANCDGESLRFFAKRLCDRKEKRKIMFVLSDGMPNIERDKNADRNLLNSDLKLAVQQITDSNIEIIGIGIKTRAVKYFYDNYVIVDKVEDLIKESTTKLKQILIKN